MPKTCKPGIWLFALMSCMSAVTNAAALSPMIDSHAHYTEADAAAIRPAAVISKLDAAGVSWLVVSGSPPDFAQHLAAYAPGRIIPLLGVYDKNLHKANWMHEDKLPERVSAQLDSGNWAGIGELHLFAKDIDNPVFAQLVKLSEKHGLVLMIHGDAEVIERVFTIAPHARLLWAHLSTRPEPDLLADLLMRHPSLWIDTSVRDDRIAPDGQLLPAWRELFVRYPDRFLVAVDTFSVNRWQQYEAVTKQIRAWTDKLPASTRRKLLHDNAYRLFQVFIQKESLAGQNVPSGH